MQAEAIKHAKTSQILLAGGMIVCVTLRPEFFFSLDQGGISNYGVLAVTIIPYTTALLGCAYYMARSAQELPIKEQHTVDARHIITIVSLFFVLSLLSTFPYQFSLVLTYAHQIISIMTTILLLLAGLWMYSHTTKKEMKITHYSIVLVCGVLLGFLTVVDVVRLLFTSQILVAFGFGGLYVSYVRHLSTNKAPR